ncbi:MAG: CDP-diacylglycerol--serine O-phosphatidyltransferase [Herpetosiphonaceae bacterium]|nr:MAG: CDP-diacylglycerol--serine O-phosphatidyltransferase [Herpetosiphonaceae bacterium]
MKAKRSWLPNLVTLANLFCGFLAILFAVQGPEFYFRAALMICLAACFDALDGRTARVLGVSGDFGKELDSLADIVSFGVAPAMLVYQHSLYAAHWIGIIAAGLFVCCGAGRLARYNITTTTCKSRFFTGMPIPMGGMFATSVALYQGQINVALVTIGIIVAALLMISTLRYPVLEQIAFDAPIPIRIAFLAVFVLGLSQPGQWLFLIPVSYMVYGLLSNLVYALRPKAKEA